MTPPYGVPDRDVEADGTHPATRRREPQSVGHTSFRHYTLCVLNWGK